MTEFIDSDSQGPPPLREMAFEIFSKAEVVLEERGEYTRNEHWGDEERTLKLSPEEMARVTGTFRDEGLAAPDAIEVSVVSFMAGTNQRGEVLPGTTTLGIGVLAGSVETKYFISPEDGGFSKLYSTVDGRLLEADEYLPGATDAEARVLLAVINSLSETE